MSERQQVAVPMFGFPIGPWHGWFAWRPVRSVDRGVVWLRPLNRRRYQSNSYLDGPTFTWFHYAVAEPYADDPLPTEGHDHE